MLISHNVHIKFIDLRLSDLRIPYDIKIRYKLMYGDHVRVNYFAKADFRSCLHILFKTNKFDIPQDHFFYMSDVFIFLQRVNVNIEKVVNDTDGTSILKTIKLVK